MRDDYRRYFRKCLKIRDKNSNIIPFEINPSQDKLIKIVEDWKAAYPDPNNRPTLFIIILKARQIGFSTCVEAIFFHELHFNPNKIAMVVSYDEDSAVNINDMANRFYQYLPQPLKPAIRPARGKGILFENPKFNPRRRVSKDNHPGLQSKFLIESAYNVNAGSSYTINYLHLSEVAKWPGDPKEVMTSLLQAVPKNDSIVVIESTAKGFNYFQEIWDKAERGENGYIPVFIPWWEHEEYKMPVPDDFVLTDEEKILKETYNLSDEQLVWRRWCIDTKCSGDINQFNQEYPDCPERAFIATGAPVFNLEKVIERKKLLEARYSKDPPLQGRIEAKYNEYGDPIPGSSFFVSDANGWLKVYKQPGKGRPYVIGIDTAEGGKDFSVMQVLDNVTGEQVATWRGHTDIDILAKQAYCLGYWYNEALIGPEVNFDLHIVKELERLNYPRIYMRETIDSITNQIQKKYGFATTKATRGPIIGELVTVVREHPEWINDLDTLEEMLTFVRNDQGRPEALAGKHDDTVMAIAIAYRIRDQQRTTVFNLTSAKLPKNVPEDLLEDYWNAPPSVRPYLAKKWGWIQ